MQLGLRFPLVVTAVHEDVVLTTVPVEIAV